MAETYRIKLLDEHEWETLVHSDQRYEHVDEDNLGFADRNKRQGYVRSAYLKDFPGAKALVAQHEFEHLLEDNPTDIDEHGIQHKKGFLRNAAAILAAPFAPIAALVSSQGQNPVVGTPHTGINQAANAIAKFTPAAIGGVLGGPAGAALGQGLSGFAQGQGPGQIAKGAGIAGGLAGLGNFALGKPLMGSPFASTNPLTQAGTAPGAGATGNVVSPLTQGGDSPLSSFNFNLSKGIPFLGNTPLGGTPASAISAFPSAAASSNMYGADASLARWQQAAQGGGGGGGGSSNGFFGPRGSVPTPGTSTTGQGLGLGTKIGLGLGAAGLGTGLAMFGQKAKQSQPPEIPELSQVPSVQTFKNEAMNRFEPLTQQFSGLAGEFGGLGNVTLPESLASPIRRQYQQEGRNLYSQFAAFRPGADLATDSEYRRAVEDLGQRQAEAMSNAQLNYQGSQRQNLQAKQQALMSQLGVTEDQLNVLQSIAQLDIATIMQRTGLAAEQAKQFKDVFGQLGSGIAQAGIMGAFL